MNITRTTRRENESGLIGAEAIEVENVGIPDQAISAATEEQTALGAFKDHQLQSLSLLCDQAVDCQFLGVRYAILQTVAGPPGDITHTGDLTQEIHPGDFVRVEGTVADDGVYLVEAVAELAGTTTIDFAIGQSFPVGAGGAVGTVARVCSHQILSYHYDIATATLATGVITILGDVSNFFAAGDWLLVTISTGNDGLWEIATVAKDGPPVTTTSITVLDRTGGNTLPDNTDDGDIHRVNPFFELAANVPFLWSFNSGIKNPFYPSEPTAAAALLNEQFNDFRGDVAFLMVNNETAETANFAGRIGTNAIIF
jgi:hypothetical protein